MALSFVEPLGDGETISFGVPFSFIKQSDVKVLVNNVPIEDFTWTSPNTIEILPAPAQGVRVRIYRSTEKEQRIVDFADGSVVDEYLLDEMSKQLFFIAQESFDLLSNVLTFNEQGNFDADSRRISNVADPLTDGDAVNLKTLKDKIQEPIETANYAARLAMEWAAAGEDVQVANGLFSSYHYNRKARKAAGDAEIQAIASLDAAALAQQHRDAAEVQVEQAQQAVALVGNAVNTAQGYADASAAAEGRVNAAIAALTPGTLGFDAVAYDFGPISTPSTYFNRDLGSIA